MLLPRGGTQGAPTTASAIMESQIKKIKSHASGHGLMSPRVRKEFLSPYTAVHNWVSALPGATSLGLFFPVLLEALGTRAVSEGDDASPITHIPKAQNSYSQVKDGSRILLQATLCSDTTPWCSLLLSALIISTTIT